MRGAEAISTYAPIPESEKFRIEYWELEEAKLRRLPKPKPLAARIALVTGGGLGHRPGDRAAARRRGRLRGGGRPGRRSAPPPSPPEIGLRADVPPSPCTADVTDEEQVAAAFAAAALAFGGVDLVVNNAGLSISKPLLETTVADWDIQHDVMARGSFLVSRRPPGS
jgi:NAD(P)-dependent dehydrogenase (short-subunit alcohol dehydrogenase family)